MSSNASRRDTENSISRFNNALRLRGDKAIAKSACRLGYCDYGHLVDPKANAKELTHPARRLVNEIFWLYLPQEIVTSLQTEESLANPAARDIIKNAVQSNGDISKVLVNHAMAIMYHTAAISNEVDFLLGRAKPDDRLWQQAYQFWKLVFSDDAFWGHIEHRIATLDDFRLKSKDIAELKDKIPRIVLSFNSVFGKYYAKSGEKNQLKRHLGFINQSGFEKKKCLDVLEGVSRDSLGDELRPLLARVREIVDTDQGDDGCIPLGTLRENLDGVLKHTDEILSFWKKIGFSDDMLISSVLNDMTASVITATNKKLDYNGDESCQSLLYGMIVYEKMLVLPLASAVRLKLEQEIRKNRGYL